MLTVPAIWSEVAKNFMKEAAVKVSSATYKSLSFVIFLFMRSHSDHLITQTY